MAEPTTEETPKAENISATSSEPETKRRRKRASGWDTPVTPAETVAVDPQQQQQELLQREQLAASIQQQMKQSQLTLGGVVQPAAPQQTAAQALAAAMSAAQQNPLTAGLQGSGVPVQRGVEHRIYVGSLNYDLTEVDVRGVFGAFGNITNVVMSHEPSTGKSKGYCFIEYESEVSAAQALQSMNGFQLAGRPIKVNKPTFANQQPTTTAIPNTTPGNAAMLALAAALGRPPAPTPATPSTAAALAAATAVPSFTPSFAPPANAVSQMGAVGLPPVLQPAVLPPSVQPVAANSFRIIVSNIALGINSDTLRTIFEPFGKILDCNVPQGGGSGILTYQQLQSAKDAVEQMDGFELLDQRLKVQWVGPPPVASAVQPPMPPAPSIPTPAVPLPTNSATEPTPPAAGSWRCTLLRNMVSVEETADEELEAEILEECTNYGTVQQVKIVVMDKESVRIFVLYETHEMANKAKMSLDTRFFGGRVISGVLYDHDVFLAGNYTL